MSSIDTVGVVEEDVQETDRHLWAQRRRKRESRCKHLEDELQSVECAPDDGHEEDGQPEEDEHAIICAKSQLSLHGEEDG